jgi:hypothetical protein
MSMTAMPSVTVRMCAAPPNPNTKGETTSHIPSTTLPKSCQCILRMMNSHLTQRYRLASRKGVRNSLAPQAHKPDYNDLSLLSFAKRSCNAFFRDGLRCIFISLCGVRAILGCVNRVRCASPCCESPSKSTRKFGKVRCKSGHSAPQVLQYQHAISRKRLTDSQFHSKITALVCRAFSLENR